MLKKLKVFFNPYKEIEKLREQIQELKHENQQLRIEVRLSASSNRDISIKLAAFCELLMPEYEAVAVHRGTGDKISFSSLGKL